MNHSKKIAALALAGVMAVASTGCTDQSWSYKSGDTSLAAGVYIYNLLNGYYEGSGLVESPDDAKDILSVEVISSDAETGEQPKSVEQYSYDYADKHTKEMLAVEDIFTKNSLEVETGDALTEYMESNFSSFWETNKDVMESYGISEKSMHYCLVEYEGRKTAVFNFVYGPNGEKAVSDEELTQYLTDKTDCYAYIPLGKDDIMKLMTAEGTTLDSDSEEYSKEVDLRFIEAKATLKEYADGINNGKKTYDDVLNDYLLEFSPSTYTDPTQSGVLNKNTETLAGGEELPACIRRLSTGKAELIETGEGDTAMYYLVYKPALSEFGDYLSDHQTQNTAGAVIPGNAKASFNTGHTRETLLNEIKGDDFDKYLEDYIAKMNIEKNESALKKYDPKMFVEDKDDSSSSES